MADEERALQFKDAGNKALAAQNYDAAIDYFSQGLELSPNNAVLYSNRAAAYASKGDWENSLLDANSAVKNKPTWGKAYNRKVLALLNLHRYDEAVATCEEGLKHEPENESLKASLKEGNNYILASERNVLAEEMILKNKPRVALDFLNQSVELHPSNALYWSNRAAASLSCGLYEQAETDSQKVIWLKPQWHKGYQRMAELRTAQRKYEEACQWYATALKIKPADPTLLSAFSKAQQDMIFEKTRNQSASNTDKGAEKKGESSKEENGKEKEASEEEPAKKSKLFGFL